jgi:uncharacterized membrane protein
MPLAATIVVLFYTVGVVVRWPVAAWYEWLAAAAGAGFAIWFWITEYQRQQRRKGR